MKYPFTLLSITLLSACIIALNSCSVKKSDKDTRIIDVAGVVGKGRIVNLSEIAKEIRYVPLETSDSSLVGNMYNFLFEAGHIYVRDNEKSIKIFDSTGRYVRTINRCGRGPEEYADIFNFHVIPQNGNITILSVSGTIMEYDMFGNFVSKVAKPDLKGYHSVGSIKMAENLYVASVFKSGDVGEFCAIVYDSLSDVKLKIPNPDYHSGELSVNSSGWSVVKAPILLQFGNDIRMLHMDIQMDTVYSINAGMVLERPFVFDYGAYREPSGSRSDISDNSKFIMLIRMSGESADYLFLWFNFRGLAKEPLENGRGHVVAIYDKNKSELILMNQPVKGKMGFKDDIEGGPVFWPRTVSTQEYLVAAHTAVAFMEFAEKSDCSGKIKDMAAGLNENDNPVIALVKLK